MRGPGINHYCIVADPGSHSYKDCLVSLVWSWEKQLGAYPPWQELVPGKVLLKGEVDPRSELELLRLHKKLTRVASYRQLQGCSHQIYNLSGGQDTLATFKLPADANVRPVQQGEVRCTLSTESGDHAVIKNCETGETLRVLPHGLTTVKLLLLQLDQGAQGMAGVAFVEYFLGWMVTAKFDKIHRIIRDLKQAAQAVPVFTKTKLWSAYLYSLNKRPFGSGAHGTAKTRMMEAFMETVTTSSPVFIKYMPRLAKEWLGLTVLSLNII